MTFDKVFTVTTQSSLEHLRDARNRWVHFDDTCGNLIQIISVKP
ncbi:MAG: hypothetical protein OXI97_18725 [Acidimicrobiaceae bacterium]|nr:hypothetical protein [Acidimicrobiaceae bacterium]